MLIILTTYLKDQLKEIETKYSQANSIGIRMPGTISKETSKKKCANSIWLNGTTFRKESTGEEF